MFDSFNNCLIVVRYGFNLVFVVRMMLDVTLNWLYDVKKEKPHPILMRCTLYLYLDDSIPFLRNVNFTLLSEKYLPELAQILSLKASNLQLNKIL